jgi:hypothetical protein
MMVSDMGGGSMFDVQAKIAKIWFRLIVKE